MPSLVQLFMSTGFVGILLLVLALAGAVAFVRRTRELRRAALAPPTLLGAVSPLIASGSADRALDLASADPSFLGRALAGALLLQGAGQDEMLANLERVAARETLERGNRIAHLVRLGVVSLLVGFLGTTLGLIAALGVLRRMKAPSASDFAGAVGESLASSAFGLLVSVLLFVAFFVLDHRLTKRAAETIATAERALSPLLRAARD